MAFYFLPITAMSQFSIQENTRPTKRLYRVHITETTNYVTEVEAESKEMAEEVALENPRDWGGADTEGEVTEIETLTALPIEDLADAALDAFWDNVTVRFSGVEHGDQSPERTIRLKTAAEDSIKEWICNNVGEQGD